MNLTTEQLEILRTALKDRVQEQWNADGGFDDDNIELLGELISEIKRREEQ